MAQSNRAEVANKEPKLAKIYQLSFKLYKCYQCGISTDWLAPDGRCGDCTAHTPDEIRGDE